MNQRFDIVIAGAGVVGLAVALLLARGRHGDRLAITVVDAAARPRYEPGQDTGLRVSAISLGSTKILEAAGVWQTVADTRACAYRDMRVWDATGSVEGPETLCFEAAEFGVPELGFIVENNLMQHALLAGLDESDVTLRFETALLGLKRRERRFSVAFDDERSAVPELLIGADGAGSFVRESAGIDVRRWPYDQVAFVTHLVPERSHRDTAWQRFHPDGPVALLPLSDGRVSTVWTTTPAHAAALEAMPAAEVGQKLTDATDGVLGALTVAGPRGSFPLKSQHAERYVAEGLALAGDAAHAVHPLAGQGLNLGLADAASLAGAIEGCLVAGAHPGDLPALRSYERDRKAANMTMLHFIDGINRLFSNESPELARLRGAGMALFNRSGPVRDYAVQTALGLR